MSNPLCYRIITYRLRDGLHLGEGIYKRGLSKHNPLIRTLVYLEPIMQTRKAEIEVTVLSDEEGQRLHDISVARLKPDRRLSDEEVKQRLLAARERNQRILARLEP
jgi:hypothetical protein